MAKRSAYILLFTLTMSSWPVEQIGQLPVLFAHFKEHRIWNPDIHFIQFLTEHYISNDHNEGDNDRDRQLPFKSEHVMCAACCPLQSLVPVRVQIKQPLVIRPELPSPIDDLIKAEAHPGSLFRPPRA